MIVLPVPIKAIMSQQFRQEPFGSFDSKPLAVENCSVGLSLACRQLWGMAQLWSNAASILGCGPPNKSPPQRMGLCLLLSPLGSTWRYVATLALLYLNRPRAEKQEVIFHGINGTFSELWNIHCLPCLCCTQVGQRRFCQVPYCIDLKPTKKPEIYIEATQPLDDSTRALL